MNKDEKYLLVESSWQTIAGLGLVGLMWAGIGYLVYIGIRAMTNRNYDLKKDFNAKKVEIVDFPRDIVESSNKVNTNKLNSLNEKQIKEFVSVLTKNTKKKNLKLMNNNLKTLNIKRGSFFFHKVFANDAVASYNPNNNTIKLSRKEYDDAIYHELFHLASAYFNKEKKISFCGFSITYNNGKYIGNGINEGYTQLLTNRFFDDKIPCYILEQKCAYIIEAIVGKEKMMDLYLNANLSGLVNELSKYSSKEAAHNFIKNLDLLSAYIDQNRLNKKSKDLLTDLLYDTNKFLIDAYSKKMTIMKYSDEEKIYYLSELYKALPSKITYNGYTYDIYGSSEQKKK